MEAAEVAEVAEVAGHRWAVVQRVKGQRGLEASPEVEELGEAASDLPDQGPRVAAGCRVGVWVSAACSHGGALMPTRIVPTVT